jgi:hypothetical protein
VDTPEKKTRKIRFCWVVANPARLAGRASDAGFAPSRRSGTSPFLMQVKDFADPDQ